MNIIIRDAKLEDASSWVEVNTYTWLTTYRGLMPDEVLDNRLKTMEKRKLKFKDILGKEILLVLEVDDKVVGILSCGESRNNDYPNIGEIYSIYLLKEYQGKGYGKKLFIEGVNRLVSNGYNSMIINVLKGNKTKDFYIKYGGVEVGSLKDTMYNKEIVDEIMYFENIDKLIKN